MSALAPHLGEPSILVKLVARIPPISRGYREHGLVSFRAAGGVRSAGRTRGGFTLAKLPLQAKLSEIMSDPGDPRHQVKMPKLKLMQGW